MSKVPDHIVAAINTMLAPYGEAYHPGELPASTGRGYLKPRDAWEYLGMSRAGFYVLVKEGKIRVVKINKSAKNGKAVFAVNELEAFMQSCR